MAGLELGAKQPLCSSSLRSDVGAQGVPTGNSQRWGTEGNDRLPLKGASKPGARPLPRTVSVTVPALLCEATGPRLLSRLALHLPIEAQKPQATLCFCCQG